jgi:hypothetical protein
MRLAVRTAKADTVKLQLLLLLGYDEENIVALPTKYGGITILNIDQSADSTLSSIRNIEALLLDEVAVADLLQPSDASNVFCFKSLNAEDVHEQYEHLSQIPHIQKAKRVNGEIFRN